MNASSSLSAALLVACSASSAALAQSSLYNQDLFPNGGTQRSSQLWIDPNNDSDLDTTAYEDFKLTQDANITHVRWYGQAAPSLGFTIAFYNQDPNTIALQPDIFRVGGGPISIHDYTSFSQTSIGGGLYLFEVQLSQPQPLFGDTQYFISITGRMPNSYTQWLWAQGYGPGTGTFYWQRADGGRYSRLGDERAVELLGGTSFPMLTIAPNPLVAGSNATFTLDNMTPSAQAYLVYSLAGSGSTYVRQLNVTLDLAQPVLAGSPRRTDSAGHTAWTLPIPASALGRNVWFQAAQVNIKTNVVATTVVQ